MDKKVAIHEAGHAFTACHLGKPFDYVEMKSDEGLVHFEAMEWHGCEPTADKDDIVVFFAGYAADKVISNTDDIIDNHDLRQAIRLVDTMCGDNEQVQALIDELFMEAKEIIKDNQEAVKRIAEELLKRRQMNYWELIALIDEVSK
jgi:ATP-dependent Zn protease